MQDVVADVLEAHLWVHGNYSTVTPNASKPLRAMGGSHARVCLAAERHIAQTGRGGPEWRLERL